MKIGLGRHFKVDIGQPTGKLTSEEYGAWRDEYDSCENIILKDLDLLDIKWDKVYTSSLVRARKTAEHIFGSRLVEETDFLREVDMRYSKDMDDFRYVYDWDIYSMIQWAKDDGIVVETILDTISRVNVFLGILEEDHGRGDNILLFTHGTLMIILGEELRKRGFKGRRVIGADNGEIYLYEK